MVFVMSMETDRCALEKSCQLTQESVSKQKKTISQMSFQINECEVIQILCNFVNI